MRHLTEDMVWKLMAGALKREERNEAVKHLLTGCPQCVSLARSAAASAGLMYSAGRFKRPKPGKQERKKLDAVFETLGVKHEEVRARIQQERLLAAGQWASLQKHPRARQLALIDADVKMHTWGLYDTILEAARQTVVTKPEQAIEIAELALAVAMSLDKAAYGENLIADFKAVAIAIRGNCKRVAENFEGARADLEMARELLEAGSGDVLERANILSLQGSWNIDLGFFKEAEGILQKAISIYRQAADDSMVGRTLVKQAVAVGYHEPERAVLILEEASGYVNSIKEPLIELCMRHALAWCLNDAEKTQEAIGVLEDSRVLYRKFPNRVIQFRLHWLEGRINRSLGNLREAEEIFGKTALDFLDRGLPQEYLLCSVDLAGIVYAQGDRTRTLQICNSLYRSLESWHMHSEGLAVFLLFITALKEGAVQQSAFEDLFRYLRQAWYLPQENLKAH
jgi:tetratricopeptide (TPR) repeat protein